MKKVQSDTERKTKGRILEITKPEFMKNLQPIIRVLIKPDNDNAEWVQFQGHRAKWIKEFKEGDNVIYSAKNWAMGGDIKGNNTLGCSIISAENFVIQ